MEITNSDRDTSVKNILSATSMWQRARGFMFRKDGRMLLSFSQENQYAIWMLFMRFSLDLVFINADKEIVHIEQDVPPLTLDPHTWKLYRSPIPAQYVLEVEAGCVEQKGWRVGDQLSF